MIPEHNPLGEWKYLAVRLGSGEEPEIHSCCSTEREAREVIEDECGSFIDCDLECWAVYKLKSLAVHTTKTTFKDAK